ncbi:hypothetical protein BC629DRAFT_1592207 [Irpex lacteus]|nr:hypothetical protein BC629DRAFT_1592207 [Irpex lacteus]
MLSTRPLALDDATATYAYTRTPAKGLLKSRGALQENTTTVLRGPKTLNTGKGKAVALRTPTQNRHSARKNGNAFQTAKKLTTVVSTKPLGDKTPFPNRQLQALQTPAPQTAKLAKLSLCDDDGESALGIGKTPGNLLLPSARRKSMRLPRSASKKFRTPDGQGRHWDVSDGDVRLEVEEDVEEAAIEEPDYDEVEYMPPKVPEQPYEPLFPLPDYKTVGKTLLDLAYVGLRDDSAERFYAADIEAVVDIKTLLEESEVKLELVDIPEDDPFRRSPTPTRPRPSSQASTHAHKPTSTPLQRTTTLPANPPPATRSSRVTSGSGNIQNTTITRVTRSTSARNALQTQTAQPQPQSRATRATATRSAAAPVTTATRSTTRSAVESRSTRSTDAPATTRASAVPAARGRPAVVARTSSRAVDNSRASSHSRAPSRAETSSRAPSRSEARASSRTETSTRAPSRTDTRAPSRASTRATSTVPPPSPPPTLDHDDNNDLLGVELDVDEDDFQFSI